MAEDERRANRAARAERRRERDRLARERLGEFYRSRPMLIAVMALVLLTLGLGAFAVDVGLRHQTAALGGITGVGAAAGLVVLVRRIREARRPPDLGADPDVV